VSGPVLVVGAGLAGLFTALKLAPLPVILVSPHPLGDGAASSWAQGGIAAAIGADDTPDLHLADTIAAGAGLVVEDEGRSPIAWQGGQLSRVIAELAARSSV